LALRQPFHGRPETQLSAFKRTVGSNPTLFRHFPESQRFSGPAGALEIASNGDVLMMLLLTALAGKQPESAPEMGFFSAPVDREISVRWGRSASRSSRRRRGAS
jgi:hypothetical protein